MKSIAARLQRIFKSTDVDVILLTNTTVKDSYFTYLTGLYESAFESSILLVERRKATLITTVLEYDVAKRVCPKEIKVVAAQLREKTFEMLSKHIKGKKVGINGAFLSYNLYNRIKKEYKPRELIDVNAALASARQIKDREEIELMRKANKIVMKAFAGIQSHLKEGVTEKQTAEMFNDIMKRNGADAPSFPTIVCFGETAAVPHHVPGDVRLSKNSFVLIDAGALYKGYCSDVTRTYIFKPDKSSAKYKRMIDMYNTVKQAQELALKYIKPGIKCEVPYNKAKELIDTAHNGIYKGRFIHGLGHQIGIDVHDVGPNLTLNSKKKIEEGMVFSDEPGIYVDGFGGVRIEDDVLVTNKGGKFI
ncbi:MAG TPA: Xaa-Pro peptidase family protein [Candidatus Acidoferrum sp.]|nr:Xaa-Pro peptidase family protein [Candidatus Acidoferrum sp.]